MVLFFQQPKNGPSYSINSCLANGLLLQLLPPSHLFSTCSQWFSQSANLIPSCSGPLRPSEGEQIITISPLLITRALIVLGCLPIPYVITGVIWTGLSQLPISLLLMTRLWRNMWQGKSPDAFGKVFLNDKRRHTRRNSHPFSTYTSMWRLELGMPFWHPKGSQPKKQSWHTAEWKGVKENEDLTMSELIN